MAETMATVTDVEKMLADAELRQKETTEAIAAVRAGIGVTRLSPGAPLQAGNDGCNSGCDGSCAPLMQARQARTQPA